MDLVPVSSANVAWLCAALVATILASGFVLSRTRMLPTLDQATGRHDFIDGLRGIAAVLVFLNHAPLVMINAEIVPKRFYIASYPFGFASGALGVQIFFCITGFLFFEKVLAAGGKLDWKRFFTSRIKRLVPLYCFAVSAAIAIAWLAKGPFPADAKTLRAALRLYAFGFLPLANLGDFEMGRLLGTVWSLPYEWGFYLLLPLLAWLVTRRSWAAVAFLIALTAAVVHFTRTGLAAWPFFLGGYIAAVVASRRIEFANAVRTVAAVAAIGLLICPLIWTAMPMYGLLRFALVSVGFVLLVIARPGVLAARALRSIGDVSYSFYLLHLPVLYSVFHALKLIRDAGALTFPTFMAWLMAVAVLTMLICSLTFRYVEYPFLKKRDAANPARRGGPPAPLGLGRRLRPRRGKSPV